MGFQLRDNVHWCDCAGRAVFLDIEADRYFCLPSEANEAFLRLAAGDTRRRDAERVGVLVSRGILVDGGPTAAIAPPAVSEKVDGDLLDEPHSAPALLSVLEELIGELRAVRLLRTRTFSEMIQMVRRNASRDRPVPSDQNKMVHAIAAASSAVSYLMRVQDRCLVRALAVHSICTRRGIRPRLVFGVIAHPFAAHCWVQLENKVLVGGFEHARLYTPILVLE